MKILMKLPFAILTSLWHQEEPAHTEAADVRADAPSPAMPSARECLHWLVANAPGGDLTKGTVSMQGLNPCHDALSQSICDIYADAIWLCA